MLRGLLFVFLGLVTISADCSGNRHMTFRVNCAVARSGGVPGVTVSFVVDKLDQSGRVVYGSTVERTATTTETGWTEPFYCDFDMKYDGRTAEFLEDIRAIATVDDEGDIYRDTARYTPSAFLNDTQTVSLRIDLPYQR